MTPPALHTHTLKNTPHSTISVSEWLCVWGCLCLAGTWVHVEVRRRARTWWSTTSWLPWQRCLERWGSVTVFSSRHHFSSSPSADVTAGPWCPQQLGFTPEEKNTVRISENVCTHDWTNWFQEVRYLLLSDWKPNVVFFASAALVLSVPLSQWKTRRMRWRTWPMRLWTFCGIYGKLRGWSYSSLFFV